MDWRALWLVFALVAIASGEPLKVATYNVRNYLRMDRIADGGYRPDYPKPESEKRVVRETIRAADPDILALQEIGSRAELEELRRDLANEGLAYAGSALLEADDGSRRVGALWKAGVSVQVVEHADLTIRYFDQTDGVKRGLLELKVEGSSGWSLFIAHLKSKYTDNKADYQSAKRRVLEARSVRDRILERFPDPEAARYLIVGDLNDTASSAPLRGLYKKGDRVLSEPVECLDPSGLTWTHYYKKEETYAKIDYILRSPGFVELKDTVGTILDRSDFYDGSDHRLVWVRVE